MSIDINEVVYYRSKTGVRIIAKVRKVNRVNSKVEVLAIDKRVVDRPNPINLHK